MSHDTALPCPPTDVVALLQQQRADHTAEVDRLALLMDEVEDPVGDEPGARAARLLEAARALRAERAVLAEVDAALARVLSGAYGLCEQCSLPISADRLQVLPRARCCVRCEADRSRRG